ncbi:phage Gp37/Gp68 family protein [Novacetimonas hansenii]|uniref:phage Gp37/Gp68 family protein n=1 Tax=Novacetimonas hansenii TaxID=436 RepID=UPI00094FFC89|nr:phage Gp37/Gp68 family protein [Novacetimonas hansenii]
MGRNSAIEWTDHTFNPWVGCTAISPACDHCYAEAWAKRTGAPQLWLGERRRTSGTNWRQPLKWDREARDAGVRRRVFCASLADVFDNQVPHAWRRDLWALIAQTPHLDWLLLTKRPQNITKFLPDGQDDAPAWGTGWHNVWLGATIANQVEAERNVPALLKVPAACRFLSIEPLLGEVDLLEWLDPTGACCGCEPDFRCQPCPSDADWRGTEGEGFDPCINWVIVGGESGPHARPMAQDWVSELQEQCEKYGIPFFFKQWGEHDAEGNRVGKKRSGALLDGREWKEFPSLKESGHG